MSLQLSSLQEADLEEFLDLDDLATRDFPYARAMASDAPKGQSRKQMIMGIMRKDLKQDDRTSWLKVTDTESGRLAAAAIWQLHPLPQTSGNEESSQASVDTKSSEADETAKGDGRDLPKPTSFMQQAAIREQRFRDNHVGKQPFANLVVLVTHPQFRRRGAGDMLVKWGCDKADTLGIVSTLHASPQGLSLYIKNGFEVVEQYDLDLSPWGVNETTIRRAMIRQPRKP